MTIKHSTAAIMLGSVLVTPVFAHDITLSGALLSSTLSTEFERKTTTASSYDTASDTALGGELALGYLWRINSGFGLEFDFYYDFLGLETQQAAASPAGGYVTNTIDGMWGLRVLPMLNITQNTKIYLDFGFAYFSQTLGAKKSGDTLAIKDGTENTAGFRYGAGISTMLYDNISLNVGYAVIDGSSSVSAKNTNDTVSYSATPTIQYFGTSITWHFGF